MKKYSFFSKEYSIIKCLFIALYGLIILIGIYLPIQTDEIMWGETNHRGIADNFRLMVLMPQCLDFESFSKPVPYILYPYYFVNHYLVFQLENPVWIRMQGVLSFLVFLSILWFILKPISKSLNIENTKLYLFAAALLSLEEIPLLLTVNRPEQALLLACSVMLFLALNHNLKISKFANWALYCIPIIVTLLAFPSHAKSIAILPIILSCSAIFYYKKTNSKTITFFICTGISALSFFCAKFWFFRVECLNSPEISEIISRHSLPFNLLTNNPLMFIKEVFVIFFRALLQDFSISAFLITRNDWIPISTINLNSATKSLYYILFAFSYIIKIFIFFFSSYLSLKAIWKLIKYKKLTTKELISFSIFCSIISLMIVSGKARMFYLTSLQIPLLIMLFLLCINPERFFKLKKTINFLIIIALINLSFLTFRYFAYVENTDSYLGMVTKYRQILFSPWEYNKEKPKVYEALKMCKFDDIKKIKRLVTDDFTYPYLKKSYMPFSFMYVTNMFGFGDNAYNNDMFFKFLKDFKSDGVFIDCKTAPDELKPLMNKINNYCCLNLNR